MRFCLHFAAQYCSLPAIMLSTLVSSFFGGVGPVNAAQFGYGNDTTQVGAYGSPVMTAPTQNFAAPNPVQAFQSSSTGSDYQSMSPDNWGYSGPSGADPFVVQPKFGQAAQSKTGSFAYGQSPARNPPVQNMIPSYSDRQLPVSPPGYQYQSTGAPAVKDLVGSQAAPPLPPSNRIALQSPFRPAQFDAQDPKDIPLAPTIPSSILDADDNRLDLPSRDAAPIAPPSAELVPVELEPVELEPQRQSPVAPQLQPPVAPQLQPPVKEDELSKVPLKNDVVEGNVAVPANRTPMPQTFQPSQNSFQTSPTVQSPSIIYPRTTAAPFASENQYPETTAPAFSSGNQYPETPASPFDSKIRYPQTTAPPIAPLTQAPLAPYQMPEVFDATPADASSLAPTTVVPQNEFGSAFGWGDAPGVFQRGTQPAPVFQQQPSAQTQQGAGPSFPLPFGLGKGMGKGLGAKLFGKRGEQTGQHNSQPNFSKLDFSQSTQDQNKRSLFGKKKQVDPNTYPPQPIPHSQSGVGQTAPFANQLPNAQFRPDLGQRAPQPTIRNRGTYDSGKTEYEFENKKREFPPFSEILATGRWFGSVEAQFVKPRFNGNSGLTILDQTSGNNFTDSQVFDFDFEFMPSLRFGFESKYGPGFEFDYRILGVTSDLRSFTSGAATSASLSSALPDVSLSSVIATTAPGQTLAGAHRLNMESIGFSVFKEVQLPVTRINGMFGFQAVDIDHIVNASVVDGAGTELQVVDSRSDMRAFGPRLNIEYFRPVGHTRLEFLTRFGGSLLFGKRDQRITGQDSFQRLDVDEIVTTVNFLTALQIKQKIGENRAVFGRIGYMNESFNGGGSGFLAQDDFGLRGFTFLVGINR